MSKQRLIGKVSARVRSASPGPNILRAATHRSFPRSFPPPVTHQSANALVTATLISLFPPPPVPSSFQPAIARKRLNSFTPCTGLSRTSSTRADNLSWCVPDCSTCDIKAASDDEPVRERGGRLSRRLLARLRSTASLEAGTVLSGVSGGGRSGRRDGQEGVAGTF